MKKQIIKKIAVTSCFLSISCFFSGLAQAELEALDDDMLSGSTAQGVTLSGNFSLNENGGPLWRAPDGNCSVSTNNGECGTRIAIQEDEGSGWIILDIFQGSLAFGSYANSDPMVLSIEERQIADNPNTPENEARSLDVISADYEGRLEYENLSLKIASQPLNQGPEPNPASQRDLMSLNFNGYSTFTGNLLLFPVD
ncbi:hypothetical protein [Parendozoicomonas sp. Alg238-R29]|uniref:hypothetical protein n=1 Tax=Parendozoicomonas sp. Alg238-R29 TaxID=2993446 RepID=UPI00248DCDD3|nr:hypothetical protein [Parendozoicomonas sp. Alg238-R29]